MRYTFDFLFALIILIILSPLFVLLSFLIYLQDFESPFYIAERVGKNGEIFKMIKFRSMKTNKKLSHIVSTSENDPRITKIGKFIRKYKIDELSQIFNVLLGNMSLVGPRPNVKVEVDLYTKVEMKILFVKPGITDFSSIVFSDLNTLLKDSVDPNIDYNQLVRPWKSRLALFYVENQSFILDLNIIFITLIGLFSRDLSLKLVRKILYKMNAPSSLISVCYSEKYLIPTAPPGSTEIVSKEMRNKSNS